MLALLFAVVKRRVKRPIIDAFYFLRFPPTVALDVFRATHRSQHLPPGTRFAVPLPDGHNLMLRSGGTDIDIFEQIFVMHDCALPFDVDPELIIDAGAHVGCSAAFFALRYPRAQIMAVEAERRNYDLLCENMRQFPNVQCVHAAVWAPRQRNFGSKTRRRRAGDFASSPWPEHRRPVWHGTGRHH